MRIGTSALYICSVCIAVQIWRHPRPDNVVGRCIGHTDVGLDTRRAKRLARRIQRFARQQGAPKVIWTSPLLRCALVGKYLKRWGWQHHTDALLCEMHFGRWDGQSWSAVAKEEIDAWCADFANFAPAGGESLAVVMARCQQFLEQPGAASRWVVGHAGWMGAAQWLRAHPGLLPQAQLWPAPARYMESRIIG
jgi:alpha-ribazole phosphatase